MILYGNFTGKVLTSPIYFSPHMLCQGLHLYGKGWCSKCGDASLVKAHKPLC